MDLSILKKITEQLKKPNYILILAWVLPIGILLTILYLNFLPFGYNKTIILDVGAERDDVGELRMELNPALGARQELDGKTFRYLDGLAYAIYEPKVVLRNATVEATLEGEGVSFVLPPDLTNVNWDYNWDYAGMTRDFDVVNKDNKIYHRFIDAPTEVLSGDSTITASKEFAFKVKWQADRDSKIINGDLTLSHNASQITLNYQGKQIQMPLPDYFLGKEQTALIIFENRNLYLFLSEDNFKQVKLDQDIKTITIKPADKLRTLDYAKESGYKIAQKDNCAYFDGTTRLIIPNSADKFESGPFTVYAEWTPELATSSQQIIGHFNWEIWQNDKSVSFQIGRTKDAQGPFYKVSYPIDEKFFNKQHSLVAVYNPISAENQNGYIELFVDNTFAGRQYFANETIWTAYGDQNLSIGWTTHNYGNSPYFKGGICQSKIINQAITRQEALTYYTNIDNIDLLKIPLFGTGYIKRIEIKTTK